MTHKRAVLGGKENPKPENQTEVEAKQLSGVGLNRPRCVECVGGKGALFLGVCGLVMAEGR